MMHKSGIRALPRRLGRGVQYGVDAKLVWGFDMSNRFDNKAEVPTPRDQRSTVQRREFFCGMDGRDSASSELSRSSVDTKRCRCFLLPLLSRRCERDFDFPG